MKKMIQKLKIWNKTKKPLENYKKYCPKPKRDKEELPLYWFKLDKEEKFKWIEENMITPEGFYSEEGQI